MKSQTNRTLLVDYFWEHAEFLARRPDSICKLTQFYRGYRNLIVKMTQEAIRRIKDPNERFQVRMLLEERHGPDLVPDEASLGFPAGNTEDSASWQAAFDTFTLLYGRTIGLARRLGSDLDEYKENQHLLREHLHFQQVDVFRFRGTGAASELTIHCQEFPRKHLYRVESKDVTVLEFDDWPSTWSRSWTAFGSTPESNQTRF